MFVGVPSTGSNGEGPLKELAILHITRVEELKRRKARK
jgi:hypothetical protein